jgi:prolyl-tRNA synthetase
MMHSYRCDRDAAGLDAAYWAHHRAYSRIFERLGLDAIPVSSDVGMMGGSLAHEFMFLNPAGEDVLVICESCGYAANRQVAPTTTPAPEPEGLLPVEEVHTPDATTIDALAEFLHVPTSRTAKAVFMVTGDGRFVVAIVRGDHDLNETKLVNAIKATGGLRPAQLDEILARGMQAGYGSPIGARDALVVVDALVAASPNLVAGANKPGYHLLNTNVGRDYEPDVVADIASVREGDACPSCGGPVILRNGIEIGNIFKLGTKYTKALGAEYLGEDGERHPIVMGSYGIGLGRNVACIVEAHHDDKGIAWPAEVAPYPAHLVAIGANRDQEVGQVADSLYAHATAAGLDREILYDDRDESPGVKLTDAELLGMPWILTVSPRSLKAGGVEVTNRATGERSVQSVDDVTAFLEGRLDTPA